MTVSSPGLPPLLVGESYLCHFRERGDGGIEFTTEVTEVTNNVVYTCDLNGTIPAFSGVKLGKLVEQTLAKYSCSMAHAHMSLPATDVSFISSLVEVPFGTEDNALTIYNCPTATRFTTSLNMLVHYIYLYPCPNDIAAVSVLKQRMPVVGAYTTSFAVEQQTPALIPTGIG